MLLRSLHWPCRARQSPSPPIRCLRPSAKRHASLWRHYRRGNSRGGPPSRHCQILRPDGGIFIPQPTVVSQPSAQSKHPVPSSNTAPTSQVVDPRLQAVCSLEWTSRYSRLAFRFCPNSSSLINGHSERLVV